MNGGVVNVALNDTSGWPSLIVAYNLGTGHLEMSGGTINTPQLEMGANGTINFSGAEAKIVIDNTWQEEDIQDLIDGGQITNAVLTNTGSTLELTLQCANQSVADLDNNCMVDIDDLIILCSHWLEGVQ